MSALFSEQDDPCPSDFCASQHTDKGLDGTLCDIPGPGVLHLMACCGGYSDDSPLGASGHQVAVPW